MSKRNMTRAAALIVVAILVVATFQVVGAKDGPEAASSHMTLNSTDLYIISNNTGYTLRGETTGYGGESLRGAQYNYGEAVRGYGGNTAYAGYFAGWTGVYGWTDNGGGDAVYGYVPSTSGSNVWAGRFQNWETTNTPRGVYITASGYTALYSEALGSYYDGFFPGSNGIYATAYWGGLMGTYGLNAGDTSLNVGDLVAISGVTVRPDGQPSITLRKAGRGDAVVGVVTGKVVIETGTVTKQEIHGVLDEEGPAADAVTVDAETPLDNYPVDGPVGPGEYASVVTSGLVQANANQLDLVGVSVGSAVISRSGTSVGILADAGAESGLVWLFFDPH